MEDFVEKAFSATEDLKKQFPEFKKARSSSSTGKGSGKGSSSSGKGSGSSTTQPKGSNDTGLMRPD
jgi:hypothetical protein